MKQFKHELPGKYSIANSAFSGLVGRKPQTAAELANARNFYSERHSVKIRHRKTQ